MARIVLFTGDGKGKTTAALGMAIRAVGHGLKVLVVQFMKTETATGERTVFEAMDGVEFRSMGLGFVPQPSAPSFQAHCRAAREALAFASKALDSGAYGFVLLDEVCGAVAAGLVPEAEALAALRAAPAGVIVVLTGRCASQALIDACDTVTRMECVKHAYYQGRPAEAGVEF